MTLLTMTALQALDCVFSLMWICGISPTIIGFVLWRKSDPPAERVFYARMGIVGVVLIVAGVSGVFLIGII